MLFLSDQQSKKSTCHQLLFPVQSGKDCGIWWKLLYIKTSQKCHSALNVFRFVRAKTKPIVLLLSSCLSELSWKWQTTSVFTGSGVGEKSQRRTQVELFMNSHKRLIEMKCFIRQYSHLKLSSGTECFHPHERNLMHNKWIMKYRKFFKQMLLCYALAARQCRLIGAGSPLTAEEVHCVSQPHEKRDSWWLYGSLHVTRASQHMAVQKCDS